MSQVYSVFLLIMIVGIIESWFIPHVFNAFPDDDILWDSIMSECPVKNMAWGNW